MTQEEFISAIKLVVFDGSFTAVKEILEEPPGRKPDKELLLCLTGIMICPLTIKALY